MKNSIQNSDPTNGMLSPDVLGARVTYSTGILTEASSSQGDRWRRPGWFRVRRVVKVGTEAG